MQLTTNYKLKKPESNEYYNVEDFNENADIIDEELKKLSETAGKVESHASQHGSDGADPIAPAMIGAASAEEHTVNHTRKIESIGLSDDTMSATDVTANLQAIYSAMAVESELWLTLGSSSGNAPNLWNSMFAKLQTDTGATWSSAMLVRIVKRSYILEVCVTPQSTSDSLYGYEYSCVFRYSTSAAYLSPFATTRDPNGFVSKSGGKMNGNLTIEKATPQILLQDTSVGSEGRLQHSNHTTVLHAINDLNDVTTRRQVSLYDSNKAADIADAAALIDVVGGKAAVYKLIHTGNMDSLLFGYAKVVTGSYVGTGTYGESNPTSIVCGFTPKLLVVGCGGSTASARFTACFVNGMSFVSTDYKGLYGVNVSWNSDDVSWYEDTGLSTGNDNVQLNASGLTYYWVAIE